MNPASGRRRFRYAPTPTRELHVGNGLAALTGWAAARAAGGELVLRIEDIDRTRCRPALTSAALADLRWLGVDWDEGPDVGGAWGPYAQSERLGDYDRVLERLVGEGSAYPCQCSRAEVRAAQRAPHLQRGGETPYAGTCRPTAGTSGVLADDRGGYRLNVHALGGAALVQVDDAWLGAGTEDVRATCGDFLLGRPGAPSYQLAVVTDDIAMGITDVVRGRDLAGSTARQVLLYRVLGQRAPRFAHHPLLVDGAGQKLSKRDRSLTLAAVRDGGMEAGALRARLGASIGLWSHAVRRADPSDFIDSVGVIEAVAAAATRPGGGTGAAGAGLAGRWRDGPWRG